MSDHRVSLFAGATGGRWWRNVTRWGKQATPVRSRAKHRLADR